MALWILFVAAIYVVSWAWLLNACRQTYRNRSATKPERMRGGDVEILYREPRDC